MKNLQAITTWKDGGRSIHTKWPAVELSLTGGIPGLRKGDVGYLEPAIAFHWRLRTPPFGISNIWAEFRF